jgi:hypothetical protein
MNDEITLAIEEYRTASREEKRIDEALNAARIRRDKAANAAISLMAEVAPQGGKGFVVRGRVWWLEGHDIRSIELLD